MWLDGVLVESGYSTMFDKCCEVVAPGFSATLNECCEVAESGVGVRPEIGVWHRIHACSSLRSAILNTSCTRSSSVASRNDFRVNPDSEIKDNWFAVLLTTKYIRL